MASRRLHPERKSKGCGATLGDNPGALLRLLCTDAGIERLNALLDNPANDSRPVAHLIAEASDFQRDTYIKSRMAPAALATFPLDPADDPGLFKCEPWGLARQMFAPHQLEIRRLGPDRIELHYGEWDARRTVFMDGRKALAGQAPTRLGHSNGRWEGDTLVVETSGIAADRPSGAPGTAITARRRALHARDDGAMLLLTATLEDPGPCESLSMVKRNWRWAPTSIIAAYDECKPPIAVKRGVEP